MKTCTKLLSALLCLLPFSAFAFFKPGDILYLRGSIDTFKIEMTLHFNEEAAAIDGYYRYLNKTSWLELTGNFDESGQLLLDEFPYLNNEPSDKSTGKFIGELTNENSFVGCWSSPKGLKGFRFTLVRDDNGNGISFNGGYNKADSTSGDYSSSSEIHFVQPYSNDERMRNELDTFIFNRLFYPEGFTVETNSNPILPRYPDFYSIATDYVNANASNEFSSQWYASTGIVWNGNGIVCMANDNWEYAGGAHGCGYTGFNCFDLKSGKKLSEKDIFLPGYEEVLRQKAIEHLDADDGGLFIPKDSLQLNGNFFLTPEGIGYFYNSYEICCYACGTPSTFIPWSEVNKWIDPNGPMEWVKK